MKKTYWTISIRIRPHLRVSRLTVCYGCFCFTPKNVLVVFCKWCSFHLFTKHCCLLIWMYVLVSVAGGRPGWDVRRCGAEGHGRVPHGYWKQWNGLPRLRQYWSVWAHLEGTIGCHSVRSVLYCTVLYGVPVDLPFMRFAFSHTTGVVVVPKIFNHTRRFE